MGKESLAIGSIISIFIALVIDVIALPDQLNFISALGWFTSMTSSISTAASPSAAAATFGTAMTGIIYYLVIFAITDVFTTIIIELLSGMGGGSRSTSI